MLRAHAELQKSEATKGGLSMKSFLIAILAGTLVCAIAVAQDTMQSPSTSLQQSLSRQAPSQEQSGQLATQMPQSTQPPSGTAQPEAPSRQAPSENDAGKAANSQQSTNSNKGEKNASQETEAKRLAPGSVIPVELAKTIDAKKVKAGDEVVAKVTQDMKSNSGEVILAKDTKFVGHVTEAQPRSKEQKESQVGITFDRAVLKNGSEMQMPMSIQAIIGPQNNNGGAGQPPEQAPGGRTAGSSSGQAPGMRGSGTQSAPRSSGGGYDASDTEAGKGARPPITAETRGVVGMPNLNLQSEGQAPNQGSVVTSEKNNVKLDSGTMLLLRVNQ
jgi:hypothetical protein